MVFFLNYTFVDVFEFDEIVLRSIPDIFDLFVNERNCHQAVKVATASVHVASVHFLLENLVKLILHGNG